MEKVQKLSPSIIEGLQVGRHADPVISGLSVVVSPSGQKTWLYRRRVAKTGTIVTLRLGSFPAHAIPDARQWATKLNAAIERGEDPRVEMRAEHARALTVEAAHTVYLTAMRRGDRKTLKPRTLTDKEAIFNRDIKPRLGQNVLKALDENECWDAVYDKANSSKDRANKMACELSCFLRWCSGREGRMAGIDLPSHPAPTLNSGWFSTGPKANTRFLSVEELKLLLAALVPEKLAHRRGVLLLLLTAARRNELFGAPASEMEDGVWTLPTERSKNGEVNIVALGAWGQRLARTNNAWLFPSQRIEGPQLCGWFKVRDRVHRRMEDFAGTPIPSWHFHDLRRTFRSHARSVGIENDIAELMINHKRKGIEAVYNRNDELTRRAAGFAKWERFLAELAIISGCASALGVPDC